VKARRGRDSGSSLRECGRYTATTINNFQFLKRLKKLSFRQRAKGTFSFSMLKPLTNLPVLVGPAAHQARSLSSGLRSQGAQVLEIPFIEIRSPRSYKPLDTALRNLEKYEWVILTSVNGVEALWLRLKKLRLTPKDFHHVKVAAIGPATRKAIRKHG